MERGPSRRGSPDGVTRSSKVTGNKTENLGKFAAAVVIPTILRPHLLRAVRSIYEQDVAGKVQILIGIDVPLGKTSLLDELREECPSNMELTVLDLGYSTNQNRGGIYLAQCGGLRTILSYAANSRYVAYLDDDNWWAPTHLSDLLAAIADDCWAYSKRWYVHWKTLEPECIDEWESVGPGAGIYKKDFGGFVDTNCMMIDKIKCHWALPAWCLAVTRGGAGEDRKMFQSLVELSPGCCTGKATVYYAMTGKDLEIIRGFRNGANPAP